MISALPVALASAAAPSGAAAVAFVQGVHDPLDSVVVHSPLPDPLIPFVQFFFQQPGWLIGTEMALGGALGAYVIWLLFSRRPKMLDWFWNAPRGARLMFIGANIAVVLVGLGAAGFGFNYMMHDNDFCKGCHIFVPSGQAWVKPDTGNYLLVNALEGKHSKLSCHSCHPFEIRAQTKEMLMWIADRPEDVPPHGRVPQAICENCHATGEGKDTWQQIAATAGHSIHLVKDTTPDGGRIQCLTCHARSAHRFNAESTTCAMSGCHEQNDIRLGRMAQQTDMHCVLCHQFNADRQIHVSNDSARALLIPGEKQCLACHGMAQLTVSFDFSKDPHNAQCGNCHNPHRQTKPQDADSTCASCHTTWRDIPFHVGAVHRGVVRPSACTQCHQPHAARVDASDCTGCHTEMRKARRHEGILPPVPFDTAAALRSMSSAPTPPAPREAREPRGKGDAPLAMTEEPPWSADTFAHARHTKLPCITCHDPNSTQKLTFAPPRGCQICHHQAPDRSNCASCHTTDELAAPRPATVTVTVANTAPRPRAVEFAHAKHGTVGCLSCHVTPVTLEPAPAAATCTSCHDQHGAGKADCTACHAAAAPFAAHRPPADAHRACAACHQVAVTNTLQPTRTLCLTCHATQRDHKPGGECTTCHLLADPATYRPELSATR